jgi:hypothetical protein
MSRTFFLFARPSFVEGMARIFDFGNSLNLYNESFTEQEADARALWSDWSMVGQDMNDAIQKVTQEEHVEEKSES